MRIISTRSNVSISSYDAILKGLSDDGGLFVFERKRPLIFDMSLLNLNYQELTIKIMSLLFDDYNKNEIRHLIYDAYSKDNFNLESIVGLELFDDLAYLELFHGPTFSFKDLALSVLPLLVKEAKHIKKINKKTVVLTATSGDTGSAALSGFSQDQDTIVIVLYPKNGISEFQELQMNSYQNENLKIFGVDGNFDDCQTIVKRIFNEIHPTNVSLSSANSINIGRLVPQIVYYFQSYLDLIRKGKIEEGSKINVCVPTGNFGNIYAAFLARQFGVPIDKLIIASNKNNVLTEFFTTGVYNVKRDFSVTHSPSMDILISSNVERYIFDLLNHDYNRVNEIMKNFNKEGKVIIKEMKNQKDFYAEYASESETLEEIKRVFDNRGYLIDPHTAVASCVYRKYQEKTQDTNYGLIVSTASPYKFSDSICEALNITKDTDLNKTIQNISDYTNTIPDTRMLNVLASVNTRRTLKIENAFEELKRMIGEIDG